MPVHLYFDVHIDKAIHDQLRLRGAGISRPRDRGAAEIIDDGRVLLRASTRIAVDSDKIVL
jgi:hypothetical protein